MCIHSYTDKYNPSSIKAIATIYDDKCMIHSDNKLASSKQCTSSKSSKHLELALKEMWWQVTSLLYQYILNVYSLNSQQKINNRFFCTGSFLLKTKQKQLRLSIFIQNKELHFALSSLCGLHVTSHAGWKTRIFIHHHLFRMLSYHHCVHFHFLHCTKSLTNTDNSSETFCFCSSADK